MYPHDRELITQIFHPNDSVIKSYFHYKHTYLEDIRYLYLDTLLVVPELLSAFFQKTKAKILTNKKQKR